MAVILAMASLFFAGRAQAQENSWTYKETKDPMTDALTDTAAIKSVDGKVTLIMQRTGKSLYVMFFSARDEQFLCIDVSPTVCNVGARFDEAKADTFCGMQDMRFSPGDSSHVITLCGESAKFFKKLSKSQMVKVQLPVFNKGPQVFEFRPAGLTWSIK